MYVAATRETSCVLLRYPLKVRRGAKWRLGRSYEQDPVPIERMATLRVCAGSRDRAAHTNDAAGHAEETDDTMTHKSTSHLLPPPMPLVSSCALAHAAMKIAI